MTSPRVRVKGPLFRVAGLSGLSEGSENLDDREEILLPKCHFNSEASGSGRTNVSRSGVESVKETQCHTEAAVSVSQPRSPLS